MERRQRSLRMQLLGRVAGMTTVLLMCGGAAVAQEASAAKETQEQSKAQMNALEDTKDSVITRTAMAYLELGKVRHSLELLRKEQESAEKILQVTQERQGEGYELPVEVTKAQLTKAQVIQRILQLEGREDELEVFLKYQLGFSEAQA